MQLTINNQLETFISLEQFRQQWRLPVEFSITYFQPKDWTGLGSVTGAGDALTVLRQRIIASTEQFETTLDLMQAVARLTALFQRELQLVNRQVGLSDVEVDFAVAGFGDILQGVAYELLQLKLKSSRHPAKIRQMFDFKTVYQRWLDGSVRIFSHEYTYQHEGRRFIVRIVNNPYGRVGLAVTTPDGQIAYVTDTALACPVSNYMYNLCQQIALRLRDHFVATL